MRSDKRGGGIGILCKEELDCLIIHSLINHDIEYIIYNSQGK